MRRWLIAGLVAVLATVVLVVVLVETGVTGNSFLHIMGVKPRAPSTAYNFWSGFGSDITEVLILGGLITAYRKHNCHTQGCWRLSWKNWIDPDGHTHALCRKHHPHDAPTVEHLEAQAARESRAATS